MHVFAQNGEITLDDLRMLLSLAGEGRLEWGRSMEFTVIGCNTARHTDERGDVDWSSISEVRIGYHPATGEMTYCRLTCKGEQLYVEEDSPQELLILARRLFDLAKVAVAEGSNGLLSGHLAVCRQCEQETVHVDLHNTAHGIAGTLMAGSERTMCVRCGLNTPVRV